MRTRVWLPVVAAAALWGCVPVKPIITPQEFRTTCREQATCPDAASAERICSGFQETVTDYYDGMPGCIKACKDKAQALTDAEPASSRAAIAATRDACLEFCNRKFYRCNCDKADAAHP